MKKIVTPEQMEEAVFTDDKQTREKNIDEVTEKMAEALLIMKNGLQFLVKPFISTRRRLYVR